ncbi:type I 3-dehydroquinate dehydratase [Candidatus Peregrinibacteria bacterium]|nr:MAG: type I 3-dehydroquinate dehydratase [Candidatus Peregrinibacteria bacterium]
MAKYPHLCVPIQETTQKKAIQALQALKGKADVAEIWLDHIRDLDVQALIKASPLPVLAVCKKPIEQGRFKGTYAEQAEVLSQAAKAGAQYVDLPLKSPQLTTYNFQPSILIVSYHNFKSTPSNTELLKKIKTMRRRGADIVKIAVTPKSMADTFRIIQLAHQFKEQKIPHILIAMGKLGVLSRVLTPLTGGTLMFAPLNKGKNTAPGQLTIKELREAWEIFS